jgi:hypothetical protein
MEQGLFKFQTSPKKIEYFSEDKEGEFLIIFHNLIFSCFVSLNLLVMYTNITFKRFCKFVIKIIMF